MRFPLALFAAALLLVPAPLAAAQAAPAEASLVYAVYVSRHGIRSPTGAATQYDRYSAAPWPVWSVPPGYLTPHGYQAMRLFGAYDRASLAAQGLLPREGCADAKAVTFRADSDQRTRETAKALAEGMFPGCGAAVEARPEGSNDPLFHRAPGTVTPAKAQLGAAAVLGRAGGNPAGIADAYRAGLTALEGVLQCGATTANHAPAEHKRTSLFDIPAGIAPGTGDHVVDMRGPLSTAATLSENLLLEYTEGMAAKNVGWGCVDGAKLRELLDLHTASFDLAQRTPAVANVQAAALLRAIAASLREAATGKPVEGAVGKPGDKALFLVGHDTNLANLAGALRLDWLADGRRNDTPPGSALVFELWKLPGARGFAVRVFFTAQTLEQMREASPLDALHPPAKAPLFVPGCSGADLACSLEGFEAAVSAPR